MPHKSSWNQKLQLHPHLHIIVPAGGLSLDHTRWVHSLENYFLPKAVLRKVFRGKFVAAMRLAFRDGQLRFPEKLKLLSQPKIFAAWLRPLFRQDCPVGPSARENSLKSSRQPLCFQR